MIVEHLILLLMLCCLKREQSSARATFWRLHDYDCSSSSPPSNLLKAKGCSIDFRCCNLVNKGCSSRSALISPRATLSHKVARLISGAATLSTKVARVRVHLFLSEQPCHKGCLLEEEVIIALQPLNKGCSASCNLVQRLQQTQWFPLVHLLLQAQKQ